MAAAVALMLCLGGIYAWSVFVEPLRSQHALTAAQTQTVFGLAIAAFTVTMVFAGRLLERCGPAPVAAAGGALFGSGYLAASASGGSYPIILGGVGLLSGAGTGCCYVSALSSCVRWFPGKSGLVAGVAVAGFGGGAILLNALAGRLLEQTGDALAVFRFVGLAYGTVTALCGLSLSFPPGAPGSRARPAPARELLHQPRFRSLAAGIFCGTFSGLMVVGSIKPLGVAAGLQAGDAGLAVSALAAGNILGRLVWGAVHDRLGPPAIPLSLAALSAALVLLHPAASSAAAFAMAAALTGFGFGACFVVYAAQVSRDYGREGVATVHPLIFLFYGLSGLAGPPVGGAVFDRTGSYAAALAIAVAVTAAGALLTVRLGALNAPQPGPQAGGRRLEPALKD